jgi:hypothetical protein
MKNTVMALTVALATVSCYRYPDEEDRWKDEIVATKYDPSADFGKFSTFVISPEVDHVEPDSDAGVQPAPDAIAEPLIASVRSELTARGYKEVTAEEDPDVGVKIAVRDGTVLTVDYYYYYPYWSWWGYYWPYYYPYATPYYSTYDNWLVTVDLVDLDKFVKPPEPPIEEPEGKPPLTFRATWTAAIYGLVDKVTTEELKEAKDGISQAFKQSPYLQAK